MSEKAGEHIVVAGATGLVGRAAVEHFARAGYRTTALSRRSMFETYGAEFRPVDLGDRVACEAALGDIRDCTRIVFAALHEEPDLVAGWHSEAQIRRNGAMLANMVDVIAAASRSLRHVTIFQGPKAYGGHVQPIAPTSRELRDDRRDIANFYWVQQDYLERKAREGGWAWTVLRPSMVIGEGVGAAMNLVAAIGVYAALLKERGEPLYFPSTAGNIFEPSDTDLIARAIDWSGTSTTAANRVFNLTNGEVFAMQDLGPAIAAALGMEPGPVRPVEFVREMPSRTAEWDRIRARYSLRAPGFEEYLGHSWQFIDFCFTKGEDLVAGLVSTVAIRQAGFAETMYSDEMFTKWFRRYQADGLLPPP